MVATNGMEALEQVQLSCPDLVVLDVVMPRINGYRFAVGLDQRPKCTSGNVFFKGEEFDRYWGMKQGANAYIVKPFQPRELLVTVKQLLDEGWHGDKS